MNVSGNFSNAGKLTSGADLRLHLSNTPRTMQPGIVFAKSNLNYSYERNDRPKNAKKAPNIKKRSAGKKGSDAASSGSKQSRI
ncbi:MAG: hypothetical protein LBB34_04660 [Holosporales bacterium]|nr:hypothetical protein [Holosporales bacterium]